jgi:hypothetical protein
MIIAFYIFQNIYLIALINNKVGKVPYKLIFPYILSVFIILYISEPSGDILKYTEQISSPHQFELLFAYNITLLKDFFNLDPKTIIYVIQYELLLFFLLLVYKYSGKEKNNRLILMLSICSVFFYLSFFNNLRQSFSLIFFGLFFLFYFEKKFYLSVISIIIGYNFHNTIIYFLLFTLLFSFILRHYSSKTLKYPNLREHIIVVIILSVIFGLLFYFLRTELADIQYFNYLDKEILATSSRIPVVYKLILMTVIYIISETLLGRNKIVSKFFQHIRFLRTVTLALLIFPLFWLLFNIEVQNLIDFTSRILFFYFFIELIYVAELIKYNTGKKTITFLLITHIFAFNVYKLIL